MSRFYNWHRLQNRDLPPQIFMWTSPYFEIGRDLEIETATTHFMIQTLFSSLKPSYKIAKISL
jgi:hypothetical protein